MYKIGFEKEFFCLDANGVPVVLPDQARHIGHDECGWLFEARGKPHDNLTEAIYSLLGDVSRIERNLRKYNEKQSDDQRIFMTDNSVMIVPRSTLLKARRVFVKPLLKYKNLYGHDEHRTTFHERTAGLHVSVTSTTLTTCKKCGKGQKEYYKNFDWPSIFVGLDEAFKNEIKEAKRNQGFYELKDDGRVEYRSLPANVDLDKLFDVLSSLIKGIVY